MEKENCILEKSEYGYFIVIFEDEEQRNEALKMINNGEDVCFGYSEDITQKEYEQMKKEGFLWIEVGI